MRKSILAGSILACFLALPAAAQLSITFGAPVVHIGINLPVYPTLQRIPGYPVYYAPNVNSNYFFYDGLYWVYDDDNWYSSSWYNGPWHTVDPFYVPSYVLRVPVRYYRRAPEYFRGWRADAPPRWDEHFGGSWEQRRSGWDRWDRRSSPAPAPLPAYQRQYSGNRYPQDALQVTIQSRSYRYQPREQVTQQHFEQRRQQVQAAPIQQQQQRTEPQPLFAPQRPQRQQPAQLPAAPIPQPMQQRQGLPQPMSPAPQQGPAPREQSAPAPQGQGRGPGNVPGRNDDADEGRGKGRDRGEERGKGNDRGEERGKGRDRN